MNRTMRNASTATALAGFSLFLWKSFYQFSDLAIVFLIPLAMLIGFGFWGLTIDIWRAWLNVALRDSSRLRMFLAGRLRAAILTVVFTCTAILLLAWQAILVSLLEASILLIAAFLSACVFGAAQNFLMRNFHDPFARTVAVTFATWSVALPLIFIIGLTTWAWTPIPGEMVDASYTEALEISLNDLPRTDGWIASVLALPSGYQFTKLWIVLQLRDYPIVGWLFSLDAALFGFVLCRSAIVATFFIDVHVMGTTK